MKIAVTGSTGLIGSALVPALRAAGHTVVPVVRHEPGPGEVRWDPPAGRLDPADLAGVDAAVHLAGAGIADRRWTASWKRQILTSRVEGTTLLASTLAALDPKPAVLVSGSAVGYYGDTGDTVTDETGARGEGFLADVVQQWEDATRPAEDAGIRVVHARTGIVLSRRGGALKKQLPIFRLGLGGRLASGNQWQSWIGIDDEVAALVFLLGAEGVRGPVNLVAPNPVRQRDLTAAIGRAVHRPAVLPVPGFALKLVFADMADEALLTGQRLRPAVLQAAGFTFASPDVDSGLRAALAA